MKSTAATTAVPRRRRREETRRRLMDAALSVFARQGYDRAAVDEIVREAGFSKGAFYVHFESKEDLFWEMLEERIARQQETFRQAADVSRPVTEVIARVLDGVFHLATEDTLWPALFMEFSAHAARNEKVRKRLSKMYERWQTFLLEMIERGIEAGRLRADLDPRFVASLLIAVVEGSVIQARLAPDIVKLEQLTGPLSQTLAEWLGRARGESP